MARRNRTITAIITGLALSGVVAASAASLNGIETVNLAADDTVVLSCDSDGVVVNYKNSYDSALPGFRTPVAIVGKIDKACFGQNMSIVLRAADGTALAEQTRNIDSDEMVFEWKLDVSPSTERVEGVSLLVTI